MYANKFRHSEGRVIGKKAQETALKLQGAFLSLLETTSWADVNVPLVTRRAGFSPATMYQYYATLSDLAMATAERLAANDTPLPKHLDLLVQLLKFEIDEGLFVPSDSTIHPDENAAH